MSTVVSKNVQIGADGTASNNFTAYQPAAPDGTLRIGNGNSGSVTDAITLTSAGNVGIGTSSPAVKLDVAGNATIQNGVLTIGKDTVYDAFINTPESMYFNVDSDGNTANNFFVWGADRSSTSGGTELMRLTSTGLGIGTTSPNANSKLTLRDGTAASLYFGSDGAGGDQAYIALQKSANGLTFGVENRGFVWKTGSATVLSGTERMRIDSSGNVGIGTSSPAAKISVQNDSDTDYNPSISAFNSIASLKNSTSGALNNALLAFITESNGEWYIGGVQNSGNTAADFVFASRDGGARAERMRITSSGDLLVGTTTGSNHYIAKAVAEGADILGILSSTTNLQSAYFMGVSSAGENAAAAAIGVRKNSSTSRSINAAGTINASGADYAEYMTKAGNFTVAKGDVVGIDANGKLTNVFADSVSFMVKSTDPSYVGGDLGQRPNDDATQEVKDAFYSALEAARLTVDRIAFAGQVRQRAWRNSWSSSSQRQRINQGSRKLKCCRDYIVKVA
jgi:hypothetical protein